MRVLRVTRLLAALTVLVAPAARGQVVRPPIGSGAINAAKAAAEKTNEQTKAAEQAGGAQQKSAAPQKQAPAPQQQKAAPPAQKSAPPATSKATDTKAQQKAAPGTQKAGSKAGARGDTGTGAVASAGARRNQVQVFREQFTYAQGSNRDPFVSLMATGELRPVFSDLVLTGVLHDTDPRKSLAMLIDISTGESYRVRLGQALGRMRITKIGLEDVGFTFDEFGLSRTETLAIDKTRKAGPAPARRP